MQRPLFIISGLIFMVMLLGSCRKSYTCYCVGSDTNAKGEETEFEYSIRSKYWSKSKAKESCSHMSDKCELK